ncbi:putative membrane protein [Bacteroides fragilis str. 2-F-2 |uniref:Putative membrane protein n=2 Tax=Bacteroides fragilis TaxID=817 RepID=A0A016AW58_BACFG|nr:putative membrane protein [Bacteroides fragilis str. 2-F-2 \
MFLLYSMCCILFILFCLWDKECIILLLLRNLFYGKIDSYFD